MHQLFNHIIPTFIKKRYRLLLLLLAIGIIGSVILRFAKQNNWLKNHYTSEVGKNNLRKSYENLSLNIEAADAALQNYIDSGNQNSFENFDSLTDSINAGFLAVKNSWELTRNKEDSSSMQLTEKLILQKILFIKHLKALCDSNNRKGAAALLKNAEGIRLTDSFTKYREIEHNAQQLQMRAEAVDLQRIQNRNNTTNYTGAGIALALLLLIFYSLRRENKRANKTSEELRTQKEHLKVILNSITECLITTDRFGNISFMNASAERLTEWSNEEAAGVPLDKIYRVVNEETGIAFANIVQRILAQKRIFELENNTILYTKYENQLIISNSGAPLMDKKGNVSGTVLVFNDITKKKEIETRLISSESFNRGLLDSLTSHIAVINASGEILKVNESWENFARTNGATNMALYMEGANYFDACKTDPAVVDDTAAKTLGGIKQVLNDEIKEFYIEYPCSSPTEERWFYVRAVKFESFEPLAIIEHHDITERKRTEGQIQESIERYSIISKATSDTIWDWDVTNNQMIYNEGINKMFGYEIAQVANVRIWWEQHIHMDDRERVVNAIRMAFEKLEQNIQLDYRFLAVNGQYKFIFDRVFILFDEAGKPIRMIGAMQDITYQKEEELRVAKEIINAQEEERHHIGSELHDNVNQILAGSLLTLDMAKLKATETEKAVAFMDKTRSHLELAVSEIRKLSHELSPDIFFENNSLQQVVEDLLASINLQ
ncbi:MAG: PAS domain S-box protein, partial [Sediminibacterium sp.]